MQEKRDEQQHGGMDPELYSRMREKWFAQLEGLCPRLLTETERWASFIQCLKLQSKVLEVFCKYLRVTENLKHGITDSKGRCKRGNLVPDAGGIRTRGRGEPIMVIAQWPKSGTIEV